MNTWVPPREAHCSDCFRRSTVTFAVKTRAGTIQRTLPVGAWRDRVYAAIELRCAGKRSAPIEIGGCYVGMLCSSPTWAFAIKDLDGPDEVVKVKALSSAWGRQAGTSGRVFIRKYAGFDAIGRRRDVIAVLVDGLVRVRLWEVPQSHDVWELERVTLDEAHAEKAERRERNRARQRAYDCARSSAIAHLRGGGALVWRAGQEGGTFEWGDTCLSAPGLLRACGLSAAEIAAAEPHTQATYVLPHFAPPSTA